MCKNPQVGTLTFTAQANCFRSKASKFPKPRLWRICEHPEALLHASGNVDGSYVHQGAAFLSLRHPQVFEVVRTKVQLWSGIRAEHDGKRCPHSGRDQAPAQDRSASLGLPGNKDEFRMGSFVVT